MKLSDLPPKRYVSPRGGANWDIGEHPRYKLLPEVQDFIFGTMNDLPPEINQHILKKYNKPNKSLLVMLSIKDTLQLEQDIQTYLETGTFP
jgi:hypothetical protein